MHLGQRAQDGVRFLPGGDAGPHHRRQRLRHVVPGGATVRAPKAHIEMGAMLAALLTLAPRAAARPVGLRERAEDEVRSQRLEPAEERRS